jgi:hypothetical protein
MLSLNQRIHIPETCSQRQSLTYAECNAYQLVPPQIKPFKYGCKPLFKDRCFCSIDSNRFVASHIKHNRLIRNLIA